jgi:hypothetical protein
VLNTDYTAGTTIYVLNYMLARDEDQARNHAYVDIGVDGLLISTTTEVSDLGTSFKRITLFSRTLPTNGRVYTTTTYAVAAAGYSVRWINRHQQYRCFESAADANDELSLDVYYYYFSSGARSDIEMLYCPYHLDDGHTCCWKDGGATCPEPTSEADAALDDVRFINQTTAHWLQRGHMYRYSPNDRCLLTPTIWDPDTECASVRDGCYDLPCSGGTVDDTVCSGNGYCVETNYTATGLAATATSLYKTAYHCECKVDREDTDLFGGLKMYGGLDCSVELDTNVPTQACGAFMCGPSALAPRPTACSYYNDIELGTACTNFEYNGINHNIEAQCDCTGTTYTGDFCTVSQCPSCESGGHGTCTNVDDDFQCVCGDEYYGDACQYPLSPGCCTTFGGCQDRRFEDIRSPESSKPAACNGHGDAVYNATSAHCRCECDEGRAGALCQLLLCDAALLNSTLVPGMTSRAQKASCNVDTGAWTCHGTWNTTRNSTGHAPYGLCDLPVCSRTLGVDPADPTICECATGSSVSVPGDSRCYRDCPNNCGNAPEVDCIEDGVAGFCDYSTANMTCSCACNDAYVASTVNGCEGFCLAPYAVATGPGSGNDRYYTSGHSPTDGCSAVSGALLACQCNCNSSWTGYRCQTDVNECATTGWCANGGTCTNLPGTYQCACAATYSGPRCQTHTPVGSSSSSTGAAGSSTGGGSVSTSSSSSGGAVTGTASSSSSTGLLSNTSSTGGNETITDDDEPAAATESFWTTTGGIATITGVSVAGVGITALVYSALKAPAAAAGQAGLTIARSAYQAVPTNLPTSRGIEGIESGRYLVRGAYDTPSRFSRP